MQKEEFKDLLLSATDQAKEFALNYIKNDLPTNNVYNIQLNVSNDSAVLTQFDLYPEDYGKAINMADIDTVVSTLLRKQKVPVWINISVSEITKNKTVLNLVCAGRYSNDQNEYYYNKLELGPFGVKSPNLPIGFIDGEKFKLPERKISFWKKFFENV